MRITRALALVGLAAAASLGLSLAALGQGAEPSPPAVAAVEWAERPDSVSELDSHSESVVEAIVTSVDHGPPLGGPDPHDQIPTQRISFETLSVLDGSSPGETFLLFKTGSDELRLANDPPYAEGERYVLFIVPRDGEPGTYLPAAPDGRVRLDPEDDAQLFIGGPVRQELEGATVEQIEAKVSQ